MKRSWLDSCSTLVRRQQRTAGSAVALSLQQLRCDDGRARLTTAVVRRQVDQEAVLVFELSFLFLFAGGRTSGESECSNRISDANFYAVFLSNYESMLLRFPDMTTVRTTDGRTDGGKHRISGP